MKRPTIVALAFLLALLCTLPALAQPNGSPDADGDGTPAWFDCDEQASACWAVSMDSEVLLPRVIARGDTLLVTIEQLQEATVAAADTIAALRAQIAEMDELPAALAVCRETVADLSGQIIVANEGANAALLTLTNALQQE